MGEKVAYLGLVVLLGAALFLLRFVYAIQAVPR